MVCGQSRFLTIAAALVLAIACSPNSLNARAASPTGLDHVYVIVLENHSFDDALFGQTPFIRRMAQTQGLATWYFGVTHPSLPNYLAMIAGEDFDIRDNAPSCFAEGLAKDQPCHAPVHDILADQLEAKGLTWALYAQDLPATGSLAIESPGALYAQKHNPFAYFRQIAANPARRAQMKSLDALSFDLASGPPSFALIVPNQCEDGHGLSACADLTELGARYDRFLEQTVEKIRSSPFWSERSAIIITFDEGLPPRGITGSPWLVDCCGGANGGHHIATIVITKCGQPRRSAKRLDHYSLLATIEDGLGLARLGKAAEAETMTDLLGAACY